MRFFRWLKKHNGAKPFSCWCEVVNPHNWYIIDEPPEQFVTTVASKCGKPDQTKEIIIHLLESRMWFFRWLRKHNPNKPFSCWCEVVNQHNWYFNNKQRNSLSVLWHPFRNFTRDKKKMILSAAYGNLSYLEILFWWLNTNILRGTYKYKNKDTYLTY